MSVVLCGRTIKGVLFDKDGTLIDFAKTYGPASADVLLYFANGDRETALRLARAVEFDLDTLQFPPTSVVIAGSQDEIVDALIVELPGWEREALRLEFDEKSGLATLENLVPVPGVESMLQTINDLGLPIGLATNDAEANGRDQLKALNVDQFFEFIFGYDSGHGAKPDPGMVLAFADAIGVRGSDILMVGDTDHDGDAARACGAMFTAVAPNTMSKPLLADLHLARTADLTALLESQRPKNARLR